MQESLRLQLVHNHADYITNKLHRMLYVCHCPETNLQSLFEKTVFKLSTRAAQSLYITRYL